MPNYKLEFMQGFEWNLEPKTAEDARIRANLGSWYDLHGALVDARTEQKITQTELAKRLEITQPAVSAFENSNTLATQIGTIVSYAAALGFELQFSLKKADYPNLPER
jgi:predicted XRE-type DNA-binding protein